MKRDPYEEEEDDQEKPPPSFSLHPSREEQQPDAKRPRADSNETSARFLMTASLEQRVANIGNTMNFPLGMSYDFGLGAPSMSGGAPISMFDTARNDSLGAPSISSGAPLNLFDNARSDSLRSAVMQFDAAGDEQNVADEEDQQGVQSLRACGEQYEGVHEAFNNLHWALKNFIAPLADEAFSSLNERVATVQRQLKRARESLETLLESAVLPPNFLADWRTLEQEYSLLHEHLQVLRTELQAVYDNAYPERGIGALVIHSQPFPNVVKQKEKKRAKSGQGEEVPLRLRLLAGARHGLEVLSDVEVTVIAESTKRSGKSKTAASASSALEGVTAQVSPSGGVTFETLRFSKGTGVNIVNLEFQCTAKAGAEFSHLEGAGEPFVLQTARSEGIIVITNESQFAASAGKLLQAHMMQTRNQVSWARFANFLQFHFVTATRQQLSQPARALSQADLLYLKTQFKLADGVSTKRFAKFWDWMGYVLHKLRHHKWVPEMFQHGFIFGFLSKQDASALLRNRPVGSFLVRFSENAPGSFAVAYRVEDNAKPVKHALVPKDNKALADWLRSQTALRNILTCNTEYEVATAQQMANDLQSKEMALSEYFKSQDKEDVQGYDDL